MGTRSSRVSGQLVPENEQGKKYRNDKVTNKNRKRRLTLDPLYFQDRDLPHVAKLENTTTKNSLDTRNIKSDSSGSKQSVSSEGTSPGTSLHTDNSSLERIIIEDFEYPFENVVFEGGGNKGLAYAGAVRELERIGIWKNIRRIGGASAGSMWAILLAIGYSSEEIEEFMGMNLKKYFLDAGCGSCSLFPNIIRHFGWHPARKLFEWFGDRLEEMTGDADTTFKQLYDRTGKELCIVVTNLSLMDAEYCHVKTTPNMPIRTAMRMSIAIPGLFGAVTGKQYGRSDIFVDGGVLCNYPVYCFDGWWLSLKSKDSMLNRLQPLKDIGKLWDKKERFGTYNHKTIGMVLYSSDESDVMVAKLQQRKDPEDPPKRPDTPLSRKRKQLKETKEEAKREHAVMTTAMSGFLRLLDEMNLDGNSTISKEELESVFRQNPYYFNGEHKQQLFGDYHTVDEIFDYLDNDDDNEISFNELLTFAEHKGIEIQANFMGYSRREIETFPQFLAALQETLLVNVKRVFVTEEDIHRTIGIDTVYIDTTDFELEKDDKKFLVEQGKRATRSFLRHYVRKFDPPLKSNIRGPNDTQSTFKCDDVTCKYDVPTDDDAKPDQPQNCPDVMPQPTNLPRNSVVLPKIEVSQPSSERVPEQDTRSLPPIRGNVRNIPPFCDVALQDKERELTEAHDGESTSVHGDGNVTTKNLHQSVSDGKEKHEQMTVQEYAIFGAGDGNSETAQHRLFRSDHHYSAHASTTDDGVVKSHKIPVKSGDRVRRGYRRPEQVQSPEYGSLNRNPHSNEIDL